MDNIEVLQVLKEIAEDCRSRNYCGNCKFINVDGCMVSNDACMLHDPSAWDIDGINDLIEHLGEK